MKTTSVRTVLLGTGKPFQCPLCDRRHVDRRSLRQHVAATHPASPNEMRSVVLLSHEAGG